MTGEAVIRASVAPGEIRVALIEDAALRDYRVERPARPEGLGDLHRARVSAAAPAMGGWFVALEGGTTGFLPRGEMPDGPAPAEGAALPVRVIRAGQGGKGPRVTARLRPGEAAAVPVEGPAPALVRRGPEAALALAHAHPEAAVETDGAALAARLRPALGAARVRLLHGPAFDAAVEAELEGLAAPEVPLPGGGWLRIHPTPALVAIDVDAGAAAGGRDARAQEALNRAAIREAARQIRLRSLGGAILLDLAGLGRKGRGALIGPLRTALAGDRLARVVGMTGLGLIEIVRQRVQAPLHEVLGLPPSPLTHGLAALRGAVREAAARPGRALALRAAPAVIAALRGWPGALEECAAALGRPLELRADPGLSPGSEAIEEVGDVRS